MPTFHLTQQQYTALIALAQRSTIQPDGSVNEAASQELQNYLREIEEANGITRYSLWIRWQDPTAPLPPGWKSNFPKTWPPNLQFFLQLLTRPLTKADVLAVVDARTPTATNIMVTPDPAALYGWTQLGVYFP
jgi:hypothetical protein